MPAVAPMALRSSAEPDVQVIWYPHKDALSLLPPDLVSHANHLESRGAIALRSHPLPAWSWLGG